VNVRWGVRIVRALLLFRNRMSYCTKHTRAINRCNSFSESGCPPGSVNSQIDLDYSAAEQAYYSNTCFYESTTMDMRTKFSLQRQP